jgi:RNA polymerase sigma-70 factor (ECF subfamily)
VEPLDVGALGDGLLVEAIVARQPEALEEAYKRHSAPVFGVARRVLGDRVLAEEIMQEVFLRLWRDPARFDATRGTLRSYLFIDANARAIELIRSDTARRGREDRTTKQSHPSPVDVEREVWDAALADHLRDALDSLSDGERDAIELAYFGDHTYREVALILDQPEGTIKTRIRTGLMRLRDRLLAVDIGADGTGGESWRMS